MPAVMEKPIIDDEVPGLDDYISPQTQARLTEYMRQKESGTLTSRPLAQVAREYGIYS